MNFNENQCYKHVDEYIYCNLTTSAKVFVKCYVTGLQERGE